MLANRSKRYSQDWNNLIREASDEQLKAVQSAANIWLEEIVHVIQSRTMNTLRLRDREVTRAVVQGSTRSLASSHRRPRPRVSPTYQDIPIAAQNEDSNDSLSLPISDNREGETSEAPTNEEPSVSDIFPHLSIPTGGTIQDPDISDVSDDEELFVSSDSPHRPIMMDLDTPMSGDTESLDVSNNEELFVSNVFSHQSMPSIRDLDFPEASDEEELFASGSFQSVMMDDADMLMSKDKRSPNVSNKEELFVSEISPDTFTVRDVEPLYDISSTPNSGLDLAESQETTVNQLQYTRPELQHVSFNEQMEALNHIEMNHMEGIYDLMTDNSSNTVDSNMIQPLNTTNTDIAERYIESASKIGFRPLYPERGGEMSAVELRDMLEPLLIGRRLTKTLIYNLLLALLPMPLILDPEFDEWTVSDDTEESLATVHMEPDPCLILADRSQQKLFCIGSALTEPLKDVLEQSNLKIEVIMPSNVFEKSLEIVYLATRSSRVPVPFKTSQDLRLQFIKALLRPYQNECVLKGFGIKQLQDERHKFSSFWPQPWCQDEIMAENQLRMLSSQAITCIPEGIEKQTLRMLQYIFEIGSPVVLDAIKTAAAHPGDSLPNADGAPSYLLQIHRYLDTKGSNNHLDVARTRYVKLCYYESFQSEVKTLTLKKRLSRLERRRKSKRLYDLVDDEYTPETDWITLHYPNVNHGSRSAQTIVKRSILEGIEERFGGTAKVIERDFNRYLRDGRNLQRLLQGADPILLILFPGEQYGAPRLKYHNLVDETLKRRLQKPIGIKNIDQLSEKDAGFFGRAMHLLRPELFNSPITPTATRILHGCGAKELQDRDSGDYATRPLEFLA